MMMTFLYEFLGPLFVVMSTKKKKKGPRLAQMQLAGWMSVCTFNSIEELQKKLRKTFMLTQAEIVEKPQQQRDKKRKNERKKKKVRTDNISTPQSILFRFALDMDICIKQTLVSPLASKVKNKFLRLQ